VSQDSKDLLVPDVSLGSDQGGTYVLTVNKDNIVEQRKVEIGPVVDGMRVIETADQPSPSKTALIKPAP
jgi:multidrug efflux pump subunit AcrA (membrane-fusion protein)